MLRRYNEDETALAVFDIQGRLAHLQHQRDTLFRQAKRAVQCAKVFNLPIIWLEQIPDKLGPTISDIADVMGDATPIAKNSFSCTDEPRFKKALKSSGRRHVLLAGVESHICVYQTCRDLLSEGYAVTVIEDAVSSRSQSDRELGLKTMHQMGAAVASVEMVFFDMQRIAEGERFKQMITIFKD